MKYIWCDEATLRDDNNGYSHSCPATPIGATHAPKQAEWHQHDDGHPHTAGTLELILAFLKGKPK